MEDIIKNRKEYLLGNYNILPLENKMKINEKILISIENLKSLDNLKISDVKLKYSDILELSKAYNNEYGNYYKKEYIKNIIYDSLKYLRETYYNKSKKEVENWWHWEIGIPNLLNDIFILMNDDEVEKKLNLETSKYFIKDSNYLGNNPVAYHPFGNPLRKSTGANRVDAIKICFIRSLLLNDDKEMISSLKNLDEVLLIKKNIEDFSLSNERDGFYEDGTFIQHTCIVYNGTYGNVLLNGIGEIIYLIKNTKYIDYINIANLKKIILKSFFPFMYNGAFLDAFNGRSITRKGSFDYYIGFLVIRSILLINETLMDEEISKKLYIELKRNEKYPFLKNEDNPFYYHLAKKKLSEKYNENYDFEINILDVGNRVVVKSEDMLFALATHSKNIGNYESMLGENTKGYYMNDGMYYYYDENNDYKEYWHNVDFRYIPGTCEIIDNRNVNRMRNSESKMSNIKVNKCIKYDKYFFSYFKFINWNDSLESDKVCIFLEDKVLFIEKNIKSENRYYTTIDNRIFLEKPVIKKFKNRIIVNEIEYIFYTKNNIKYILEFKNKKYFLKIICEYEKENKLIWIFNPKRKAIKRIDFNFYENDMRVVYDNKNFDLINDEIYIRESEYCE